MEGATTIDTDRDSLDGSTLRSPPNEQEGCDISKAINGFFDEDQAKKAIAPRQRLAMDTKPTKQGPVVCSKERRSDTQIRVEASILPLHQCDQYCLCQCHQVTNLATPNACTDIIGRLFIGYIGLPLLSHQKCNRVTCKQGRTQARIRIAYLFPMWFALRLIALTITKASTTFMWTLSFPIVTQSATPLVIYTSLGNMTKVQSLLSSKEGTVNTIDATASKSPLHVST